MYVVLGKEKSNRCGLWKTRLDEKGMRYHYLDMIEMPHKTMTCLQMYCSSYPIVLSVDCLSVFNETLEQFAILL